MLIDKGEEILKMIKGTNLTRVFILRSSTPAREKGSSNHQLSQLKIKNSCFFDEIYMVGLRTERVYRIFKSTLRI